MENKMVIEKYIQSKVTSEIEDNCLKETQDFLKLLSGRWTINILYTTQIGRASCRERV